MGDAASGGPGRVAWRPKSWRLCLFRQWARDGKKLPLEEIIALSGELLCNGANGFMKKAAEAGRPPYSRNGVAPRKKPLISSGLYCSLCIHHLTVSAKSQTRWLSR